MNAGILLASSTKEVRWARFIELFAHRLITVPKDTIWLLDRGDMRKAGAFSLAVALIAFSPLLIAGRSVATPDGNNDFATAVEAQKGYQIVESVSTVNDLDDFYKIYLEVGQEIVANLLVPAGADFELYLYDPGQNEINWSERDNILEDNPY